MSVSFHPPGVWQKPAKSLPHSSTRMWERQLPLWGMQEQYGVGTVERVRTGDETMVTGVREGCCLMVGWFAAAWRLCKLKLSPQTCCWAMDHPGSGQCWKPKMRNSHCTSWIGPPQRTTVTHEATEGYVWVCCPDAAGLMPEALVTTNSLPVFMVYAKRPEAMLVSVACTALGGHIDASGLCCHQRPC